MSASLLVASLQNQPPTASATERPIAATKTTTTESQCSAERRAPTRCRTEGTPRGARVGAPVIRDARPVPVSSRTRSARDSSKD